MSLTRAYPCCFRLLAIGQHKKSEEGNRARFIDTTTMGDVDSGQVKRKNYDRQSAYPQIREIRKVNIPKVYPSSGFVWLQPSCLPMSTKEKAKRSPPSNLPPTSGGGFCFPPLMRGLRE